MKKGNIYATSDWHGNKELAFDVLDWLKPEDTLYFLGDAIDRGRYGIEILERLLKDPRVKMICGNHERMMCETLRAFYTHYYYSDLDLYLLKNNCLWAQNGGYETYCFGLADKSKEEIFELIDKLEELPNAIQYKNRNGQCILMEHAGHTPELIPHRSHDPYWDRTHFHDKWDEDAFKNVFMIHGHTPVQYLNFAYGYIDRPIPTKEDVEEKNKWNKGDHNCRKPEILNYCGGHKFDIDMCTISSNRVALLDLNTFEKIYFDTAE